MDFILSVGNRISTKFTPDPLLLPSLDQDRSIVMLNVDRSNGKINSGELERT